MDKINSEYEIVMCDDGKRTGLLKLPFFHRRQSLDGIPYRLCQGVNGIKSEIKREYCGCHDAYYITTPFSRYSGEDIKVALKLAKTLGVNKGIKLYYPTRPHHLIFLFPPNYEYGIFIKEIKEG